MKSTIATDTIACAVQRILPAASVERLVLADGGEGTLETFGVHFGSVTESRRVRNPLGRMVSANLCFLEEGTAVIETSQAIGFSLVKPAEMNPFMASSYGVGELINYVVNRGATKVMITMGDSATMDMGVGMLHALGVKFYSASGGVVDPALHNLREIVNFDATELCRLRESVTFLGLVDTNDYLCGEIGQVQLYGRQKGLKDSDIPDVESAFFHFAEVIERRFGVDVTRVVRSTGSGGVAAALHTFLDADLVNTLDYLSERLQLDEIVRGADITITGEGCLDNQTRLGKVPYFVATRSSHRCIGIVGKYTEAGLADMQNACSRFSMFSMNPEFSMTDPVSALRDAASAVCSLLRS